MPARHFIIALYVLIIALAFLLLFPTPTPSAVNWNSEPIAGFTWAG